MPPIDPTIPLGAQAPNVNPLASLSGLIQTGTGLVGLQAAQQKLGANQAISQAYAASTDPNTGQVDFNKLQALATQAGAGAFLPEFMGQIAEQRNKQLTYETGLINQQKTQLDLALARQTDLRNRIGSLMVDPQYGKGDMTGTIINALSMGVQSGTIPAEVAQREAANIPTDPAGQAQWIKQHFMNAIAGEAKINAMRPQTQVVNTGGAQQIVNIDPLTGQPTVAGVLQNTLSPEAAASRVQTMVNGVPGTVSLGSTVGGGQTGAGRYPGAGPAGAPGGFIPTGPALGEEAAATETSRGSAQQLVSDQNAMNGMGARMYQLQAGLHGLQNATTGKGSDALNSVKSYLQTAGIPGVDASKIQSFDEANKYLTQYAMNQAGSMGEGTDKKLSTALSANASTSISNLAAQDVVKANMGLERMRAAQVNAFNNSGMSPSQYQKFSSEWNSKVDPRVFIWDMMDNKAKTKVRDSMSDKQRSVFSQQYNTALQQGWIGQ